MDISIAKRIEQERDVAEGNACSVKRKQAGIVRLVSEFLDPFGHGCVASKMGPRGLATITTGNVPKNGKQHKTKLTNVINTYFNTYLVSNVYLFSLQSCFHQHQRSDVMKIGLQLMQKVCRLQYVLYTSMRAEILSRWRGPRGP